MRHLSSGAPTLDIHVCQQPSVPDEHLTAASEGRAQLGAQPGTRVSAV